MNAVRLLLAAAITLALSGCFTSTRPLVTDDTGVAPYATLTFDNGRDDPVVFTREAGHYVTTTKESESVYLHLLPVEDDLFVGQLAGPRSGGGLQYLYGYMRLDPAGGVAEIWRSTGRESDVRPGLSQCDGMICIDDLDAYIAYGREAVAEGLPPDTTYAVTATAE